MWRLALTFFAPDSLRNFSPAFFLSGRQGLELDGHSVDGKLVQYAFTPFLSFLSVWVRPQPDLQHGQAFDTLSKNICLTSLYLHNLVKYQIIHSNYTRGCVQPPWIWYGWISLTNLLLRYYCFSQVSSGVPFETRQSSDPGVQWLHHWGDGTRTTQVIPKIFLCNSSYQTSHKIWRWFPKYSCGWTFSVDSKLYSKPQTLKFKWLVSRINR